MVTGVHAMFYSKMPEEERAFLRDKIGLPFVDVGGGWLIFAAPSGEIGCHPAEASSQDFSFMCDDIHATVAELKGKGVEFAREVRDDGFGLTVEFLMPSGLPVTLYQPRYTPPKHP